MDVLIAGLYVKYAMQHGAGQLVAAQNRYVHAMSCVADLVDADGIFTAEIHAIADDNPAKYSH